MHTSRPSREGSHICAALRFEDDQRWSINSSVKSDHFAEADILMHFFHEMVQVDHWRAWSLTYCMWATELKLWPALLWLISWPGVSFFDPALGARPPAGLRFAFREGFLFYFFIFFNVCTLLQLAAVHIRVLYNGSESKSSGSMKTASGQASEGQLVLTQ